MNNLPTEILLQVTNYLSLSDVQQCLFTCRKWHRIFKCSYYHSITIHNSSQFDNFLTAIKQSAAQEQLRPTTSDIPMGHLVKVLQFCKFKHTCLRHLCEEDIIFPRSFTEQLPALCPNLETLDLGANEWLLFDFHSNLRNMRHLRKLPKISVAEKIPFLLCLGDALTSLTVDGALLCELMSQQCLLSTILSFVPNLVELVLGTAEEEHNDSFEKISTAAHKPHLTIEQLECIHNSLPKLRVLAIQKYGFTAMVDERREKELLDQSRAVKPARSICNFSLDVSSTSYIWLIYAAHKYPNLRYITVSITDTSHFESVWMNNSSISERYREFEQSALTCLLAHCQYIESIAISCSTLKNWLNSSFLQKLQQMPRMKAAIPLKNKNNQIQTFAQLMIAVDYGKSLLTTLEVDQWRFDESLYQTLKQLKNFNNLMSLDLKCDSYHDQFCLDAILDNCPQLEELALQWGTLYTPTTCTINWPSAVQRPCGPKQSRLRSFRLTFSAFRSADFAYLAQRCPNLNYLLLTRCKCLCEVEDFQSQCAINLDMPNHSFRFIGMDNVRLDCPSAPIFYPVYTNYVRLMSIETNKWQRWYQHERCASHNTRDPQMKQLDTYEAATVSSYFANVKKYGAVASGSRTVPGMIRCMSELRVSNALKLNLLFGYVKVRCTRVENIQLESVR